MTWLAGYGKTSYTHHHTPITLSPKDESPKDTIKFSDLISAALPPCRLNPFLFNGHLQTMWTSIKDAGPPIHYKRRIFESTHSVYPGQYTVDFAVPPINPEHTPDPTLPERTTFFSEEEFGRLGSEDSKPMLVCLHGLTGGSHEVYLREVIAPLIPKGWTACVINARGCALSAITTPQLFNSRSTWDVRELVSYLTSVFPNRPLFAVGFSLGANILTNYVGEEGEKCVLKSAVAVSNPWNLEVCNVVMKRSLIGLHVYMKVMGGNMMGLFKRHREQILKNEEIDEERVNECKYLFEFDRVIQAPTWGYATEGSYYRDAQSVDAVLAIKIPFLAINAEDDPISCVDAIPYQEFKQNPYTVLCTTNWGGHLSWFQLGGGRWFATAVSEFLTKMHDEVALDVPAVAPESTKTAKTKKFPIFDATNRRLILPLS
ncbi:AB-hydrolase YheT [Pleomassaria siparia CBS 279.74]|uniref:alcohol O-acetyltransferase n=1 Tax=Pleomassaria siparia CBS 279.74 TaxID=1314801 RepID=A0A6G1KET3_9PLEO|nr:AB-hydrolase YheT [Pleomassaria siparia CBS 279.74]